MSATSRIMLPMALLLSFASLGRSFQVLYVGPPRTGTQTMYTALTILGLRPLHSGYNRSVREPMCNFLYFNGSKKVALNLLNGFDAAMDEPFQLMYDAVMEEFPNAKFILPVTTAEQWMNSYSDFFENSKFPKERRVAAAAQKCGVYIDSAGIWHRDLKPGLSRRDPKRLDKQLTDHVVTRYWMAPELILGLRYTKTIDLGSVGCILAEILAIREGVPVKERQPLFVGSSRFPFPPNEGEGLSPRANDAPEQQDQVSLIYDILATPEAAYVDGLERASAQSYSLLRQVRRQWLEVPWSG